MDDPKSPIESFGVSLGSSLPQPQTASGEIGSWNILVCSDLGFVSREPRFVRIAEWNELMQSSGAVLSGTAPDLLTGGGKPLFVELPLESMKDFSTDAVAKRVPEIAAFSKAAFAVRRLLDGTTSLSDASAMVAKAGLPAKEARRIADLLGAGHSSAVVPGKAQTPASKNESVDKILSMMNMVPSASRQAGSEGDISAGLFQAVSGSTENINKKGLSAWADESDGGFAIRQQPLPTSLFSLFARLHGIVS